MLLGSSAPRIAAPVGSIRHTTAHFDNKGAMRRLIGCLSAVMVVLAASTAPAVASTQEWMTNAFLGTGLVAHASSSAHSGVTNTHKNGQPACPAVASGYSGATSTPNSGGNFTAIGNCGDGDRIWHPNDTASYFFHGAVYSGSGAPNYFMNYARYSW